MKGKIKVGFDADLVVWDPEETVDISRDDCLHRHPDNPFVGRRLFGAIKATYVHGEKAYENGQLSKQTPGRLIRRCKSSSTHVLRDELCKE